MVVVAIIGCGGDVAVLVVMVAVMVCVCDRLQLGQSPQLWIVGSNASPSPQERCLVTNYFPGPFFFFLAQAGMWLCFGAKSGLS